jgi:hypothetical protein
MVRVAVGRRRATHGIARALRVKTPPTPQARMLSVWRSVSMNSSPDLPFHCETRASLNRSAATSSLIVGEAGLEWMSALGEWSKSPAAIAFDRWRLREIRVRHVPGDAWRVSRSRVAPGARLFLARHRSHANDLSSLQIGVPAGRRTLSRST